MIFTKYIKIAQMNALNSINGGIIYLIPGYLIKLVYLIPLLLLWRTLMSGGVKTDMSLSQMLTYTYLGVILSDILVVRTAASNWFYEGLFISLYQRPTGILLHLVFQTIGGWVPQLLFFTLPMIAAAPLIGVSLTPYTVWFVPSLLLCISLGFAVDILFSCLTIRMKNASWLVYVIRNAIVALLSGSVIPFAVLPWGIGSLFQYLPFGSLAGAPLSIFTGLSDIMTVICTQVAWNLFLWPAAIIVFQKTARKDGFIWWIKKSILIDLLNYMRYMREWIWHGS